MAPHQIKSGADPVSRDNPRLTAPRTLWNDPRPSGTGGAPMIVIASRKSAVAAAAQIAAC
jgi:hypothetical protein